MLTRTRFLVSLAFAVGYLAPAAEANVYCVAPAAGCPDGNFSSVQTALGVAKGHAGPDEPHLGAAEYMSASAFSYDDNGNAANTIDISGAGRGATTLTRSTNGAILLLGGNAREKVHDLRFHITGATNSFGIQGGAADVSRVDVDADAAVTNSEGIQVSPGSASDVRVTMQPGGGTIGVVAGGPAASDGVFDSKVTADTAVMIYSGSLQHSLLAGGKAVIDMGGGRIDDVVARVTGTGSLRVGLRAGTGFNGGTNSLLARHVTILGDGLPGSVGVLASGTAGISAGTETVDARNTIVRGFEKGFERYGISSGGQIGTANLSFHYSDYDPAGNAQSGPGTGPDVNDPANPNVDPQFVDAAGGDLRLRGGAPLIDAGDPAALAGDEPVLDFAGATRVLDGNGDGATRRDIGALEYLRQPPVIAGAS